MIENTRARVPWNKLRRRDSREKSQERREQKRNAGLEESTLERNGTSFPSNYASFVGTGTRPAMSATLALCYVTIIFTLPAKISSIATYRSKDMCKRIVRFVPHLQRFLLTLNVYRRLGSLSNSTTWNVSSIVQTSNPKP